MTRRLLLGYLTITVVVLLLLELPLAVFFQQRELNRLTVDVERDATVMATIYEDALEKGLPPDPTPAADYRDTTMARVVVVDADGISIVDTDQESDRDFSTRPEIAVALTGDRASGTRYSVTLDTELLYVAVPVASGGTVHGALRITLDTHEVTERVWRFWIGLIAIAVVILTVMAGVGWLIARSVTRPVRRLQSAAERFSSGDLSPITPDSGAPAELAALETGMNDMAIRLDELIERQRSFVADASHQLRTPLTALRLRLENLQSGATDPAVGDEIAATIDETTRLSTLVDDLLRLARAERMDEAVDVDLAQILRERIDVWTATAELAQVRLDLDVGDREARALAVPGGTEQVLDNLLDNAIRAAPPGSVVSAILRRGADHHSIAIADLGPGMSDDDKTSARARFWRSDTSTPGTGLGIPIAESIVRASGGSIELTDNVPTGLVATITLPAAPPAWSAPPAAAGATGDASV